MLSYILYRVGFALLTIFIIFSINFAVLNITITSNSQKLISTHGLDDNSSLIELQEYFNEQDPVYIKYLRMMKDYATFNFGKSQIFNIDILDLILQKMPVSLSLGLVSTIVTYILAISLAYFKAKYHGSLFDAGSSFALIVLYSIPTFVLANFLIFAFGNSFLKIGGLVSADFYEMSWTEKIIDYILHVSLPIAVNVCYGLFFITVFCKGIFLTQLNSTYYMFARYKGLSNFLVFKNHLLKNFLFIFMTDISSLFLGILFGGSLFIEIIFNLDGMALLSYEALVNNDYNVLLANVFIFAVIGVFLRILNDIFYMSIDKRVRLYKVDKE